jgi:hypothetical protein
VIEAFEAGVVRHTRRVAIFESDGTTPWNPTTNESDYARLISGSVTVDYNSAERRTLDLVLDNRDMMLRPNPDNGFWYDKIIKVYRGIQFESKAIAPRTAIIEQPNDAAGLFLRTTLSGNGFDKTVLFTGATSSAELEDYSFVVAFSGSAATTRSALLKEMWTNGKHIVTIGTGSDHTLIPLYSASAARNVWGVAPAPGDHPARGSFTTEAGTGVAGTGPTAAVPGAVRIAVWPDAVAPTHVTAAIGVSPAGGYWLDVHLPDVSGPQARNMIRAAMNFMRNYTSDLYWEVQQGEFMIDTINADHFPDQVKITGRDYAKKLMLSKLENSSTFTAGTSLATLVKALATNGGADPIKFNIGIGNETILSDMSYERGTDRWTIIYEACQAFGYEVFFSPYGAFTVRKYVDPTTSPVMWTFKTGYEDDPEGANLVSYSRASNDSRIYNHVVVYSDPADGEERLPYFGEAKNTDPSSPTRITKIGDRMLPIVTNWLGSDAECKALAESRLKISALESYDLSFSSIYYPWLEVGEIAEILDPDRLEHEPTKFLVDNIQYPLDLGPMTATGKRITFVGSSGTPDTIPEGV